MSRASARAVTALVAIVVVIAACQASAATNAPTPDAAVAHVETVRTAPPTATAGPSTEPAPMATADLVLMGDSVLLQAGPSIQRLFEERLGVTLRLHDWINPDLAGYQARGASGGERSADLLARLRTDDRLRLDVSGAEVIVLDVPFGVINDECPDPSISTAKLEACFDRIVPGYRADVDAIFDEVVALRDPADAIIRATDVWQFLWPTLHRLGRYEVARPAWQAMNGAVADAAARHGIPLVLAYDLFTGADGGRDPVAAGDVLPDELHLTGQGVERFVDELAALGFGTAGVGQPASSDGSSQPPGDG